MLDVMPFDETSETELALHVLEEQAVGGGVQPAVASYAEKKKSAKRRVCCGRAVSCLSL